MQMNNQERKVNEGKIIKKKNLIKTSIKRKNQKEKETNF